MENNDTEKINKFAETIGYERGFWREFFGTKIETIASNIPENKNNDESEGASTSESTSSK